MALLMLAFMAELPVALAIYFLFRARWKRPLIALALIASIIGLTGGWTVVHRAAANYAVRDVWDNTNAQMQKSRGTGLSQEEWRTIRLEEDPVIKLTSHKVAAIHALPAFLVVLMIVGRLATKHERRRKERAVL